MTQMSHKSHDRKRQGGAADWGAPVQSVACTRDWTFLMVEAMIDLRRPAAAPIWTRPPTRCFSETPLTTSSSAYSERLVSVTVWMAEFKFSKSPRSPPRMYYRSSCKLSSRLEKQV